MTQHSGKVVRGTVSGFTNSGNPVIECDDIDDRIVIVTEEAEDIDRKDSLQCKIKRHNQDHYQAIPADSATVSPPEYDSPPNIPLHHDGKYGQSVGDTRKEYHSIRSVSKRGFDPETHDAPPLSRDPDEIPDLDQTQESDNGSFRSLNSIARGSENKSQ